MKNNMKINYFKPFLKMKSYNTQINSSRNLNLFYTFPLKYFSKSTRQTKQTQLKKRIIIKDSSKFSPKEKNPIVYEDENNIIYEDHPIHEVIDLTDRDFRESRKYERLRFKICGLESQVAIIDIHEGHKIKSETVKVIYLTEGIEYNTITGGFMSSFKRLFSGSTLFMTEYYYKYTKGFGRVAFSENFPSKIIPIRFSDYNGSIICQKGAFLCGMKTWK